MCCTFKVVHSWALLVTNSYPTFQAKAFADSKCDKALKPREPIKQVKMHRTKSNFSIETKS